MPGFSTEIPHNLGREGAQEKLRGFAEQVGEKYKDQVSSMTGEWTDNVLNFALTTYGFTIKGVLTVEEELAKLDASLPFAALAFKGKIEQSFAAEIRKALAR
jgi:hypothetical protein